MAQGATPYESAVQGSIGWKGTSRYQVLGCLGLGGMGAVYEVLDRERSQAVALKTLLRFDPAGLYRFKQEFRTLADVQHPNLVRLYELVIGESGEGFFTMELVRGQSFTQYTQLPALNSATVPVLTRVESRNSDQEGARQGASGVAANAGDAGDGGIGTRRSTQADVPRLRAALAQLAAGVNALHIAGKLHRDIKPSNALVTEEGRVVLLDFGVATELSNRDGDAMGEADEMVGTVLYMAPEQADETPPSAASDWYSVGVMLYEAFVGAPPFVGTAIDVLTLKSTLNAALPSDSVDGVPPDLDALCRDLLEIQPERRPDGDEILRRLGVHRSVSSVPPRIAKATPEHEVELVGREAPLASLAEAFDVASGGRTVTLFVTGASGMGKTRLVNHFVDGLVADQKALVLRGRAYEREAVPYKAFDAVMDSLSRHLMVLLDADDEVSLPEDCGLLGRVFPVLQRHPALARMATAPVGNPQTVRRRAFVAVRELLGLLSKRAPVVIFIDDVHWGDPDSAGLLLELVRPPSTSALLLIMTYQDSRESSPFLNEIRERWPASALQRRLPLGGLGAEDACRLASLLMDGAGVGESGEVVARESQGKPFLIEELVRASLGHAPSSRTEIAGVLSVDQMIVERLGRLPSSARRLAEVIAVGGRPLPISVALQAASVDAGSGDELVTAVCGRRFARIGLRDGRDVLEPTYDQIRERVVAQLPEETLRQHHTSLALALQAAPDRDGEAIAEHWLGARECEKAAAFALEAAEWALAKFAFDQSARLFRLALDNTSPSSPEAHGIRLRLARALQLAGRSTESGREYLRVVGTAPPEQRLELRRIAAEQLLAAGRIDEGEPILRDVLASCGMNAPRSPFAALIWLVVYSIWIRLRGYHFKERAAADVSAENRMRVDALLTVGTGYGIINSILSLCMMKRQLIEALRVGDRSQAIIALGLHIIHMGNDRADESARERALARRVRELANRADTTLLESYVDVGAGLARFFRGQWGEARELLERADARARNTSDRILAINARLFADYTYFYAGDFAEYRRRSDRFFAEAEDRGDLYTTVTLSATMVTRLSLASGEIERGRETVREVMARWPQTEFLVQHWLVMTNAADFDVYDGFGGRAYDQFMQSMPALKKSLLLGTWFVRALTWQTWGRLAIASIASNPEKRQSRIAEARAMARRLAREPSPWAAGMASFVKSSAEIAAGERAAAIAELRRTVALCAVADSAANGIAARYRLGQILGDDEGRELVRQATETLQRDWQVRDPERYVSVMLPGQIESLRRPA